MYKITILGDIMFQKDMLGCKYDKMFENVKQYLSESDLVIANLETPIDENVSKDDITPYRFVAPIDYVRALKRAHIGMVSTANNHCLDNGKEGVLKTIDFLDRVDIQHIGTYRKSEEKKYIIRKIANRRVAFVANTYGTNAFMNGIYLDDEDDFYICMLQSQELSNKFCRSLYMNSSFGAKLVKRIFKVLHFFQFDVPVYERRETSCMKKISKELKEMNDREHPDYIIMMMHDGGQNNAKPINRTKVRVENMRRIGIDAIIANHEHMVHNIEVIDDKIATYSLGNFMSLNGVICEPFDKMQDYSIGVNLYLDGKNVEYTFVIFKVIYDEENDCVAVNLLYDLIQKERDAMKKEKLKADNSVIVSRVVGEKYGKILKKEYKIEVRK